MAENPSGGTADSAERPDNPPAQSSSEVGDEDTPPPWYQRVSWVNAGSLGVALISAAIAFGSYRASVSLVQQSVDDRVFDISADSDWNLTISQVGGTGYQIRSITLVPTFQLANGRPVTREGISVDLQSRRIQWPPKYHLESIDQRLCELYRDADQRSICESAASLSVDVVYTVIGQKRTATVEGG